MIGADTLLFENDYISLKGFGAKDFASKKMSAELYNSDHLHVGSSDVTVGMGLPGWCRTKFCHHDNVQHDNKYLNLLFMATEY